MKTVHDHVSGQDISIDYVASSATATMCHGTAFIKETIPKGSRSMAQVAYSKGDLESFGSFFNMEI